MPGSGFRGWWLFVGGFLLLFVLPALLRSPAGAVFLLILIVGGFFWFWSRMARRVGATGRRVTGWQYPGGAAPPREVGTPAADASSPLPDGDVDDAQALAELEATLAELARQRDAGAITASEYETRRARAIADF